MSRRALVPRIGMAVCIALLGAHVLAPAPAAANVDLGCCQFTTNAAAGGGREPRCSNTTRIECNLLRPNSVFFRGWGCDETIQRCVIGFRTRTPTPTSTPLPTRTPTPAPDRVGCCQLDNVPHAGGPLCANAIDEASCLTEFAGSATFCTDCSCSAAPQAGLDFTRGQCATNTPRPTATPTPAEPRGCCQLARSRGPHGSICGNEISQSSCLGEFGAGATFCADCVCSSHTDPGFDLAPGACVPRSPTPRPPRRPPHPSRRPQH